MSFSSESRQRSAPVLPMAAMVDMLFLLLIFFLYQASKREQEREMPVNLQAAASAYESNSIPGITVTIDEQNRIFIGSRQYTPNALVPVFAALASQLPGDTVIVRADKTTDTGVTIQVIDMIRTAKLRHVLMTAKQ